MAVEHRPTDISSDNCDDNSSSYYVLSSYLAPACVLVSAGFLLLWAREAYQKSKLPPGPKGLPLIGNVLDFRGRNPLEQFLEWSVQYPGMYTVSFLGAHFVVVNSLDTVLECTVQKTCAFAGRPYLYRFREFVKNRTDVITTSISPVWSSLKKASVHSLKTYGDGLQHLETITTDILKELVDTYKEMSTHGPCDIFPEMHESLANVITTMMFGKRVDQEHVRQMVKIEEETRMTLSQIGAGSELDAFPFLKHVPFNKGKKKLLKTRDETWSWVTSRMKEDVEEGGAIDILRKRQRRRSSCYVNGPTPNGTASTNTRASTRSQSSGTRGKHSGAGTGTDDSTDDSTDHGTSTFAGTEAVSLYSEESIEAVCINLITAGVITTSTAVYCLVLIFLHHPHIQRRAQQEVDDNIGSRSPKLADRQHCHYVESMILELLRYISHVPLAVPHEAIEDTSLGSTPIPKGTQVMIDLFSLHHSKKLWGDPWRFNPERFLDASGKLLSVDHPLRKQLLPFGAGRRSCLGESLARNRMFLFVSTLLQRFTFTEPGNGLDLPDCDPRSFDFGLLLSPHRFLCNVTPRD